VPAVAVGRSGLVVDEVPDLRCGDPADALERVEVGLAETRYQVCLTCIVKIGSGEDNHEVLVDQSSELVWMNLKGRYTVNSYADVPRQRLKLTYWSRSHLLPLTKGPDVTSSRRLQLRLDVDGQRMVGCSQ